MRLSEIENRIAVVEDVELRRSLLGTVTFTEEMQQKVASAMNWIEGQLITVDDNQEASQLVAEIRMYLKVIKTDTEVWK